MTASEWDIQLLRGLGISAADEFASLDAQVGSRVVAEWQQQSSDVKLLVYRLRAALKAQNGKRASVLLDREAEYGRAIEAWLVEHMPDVCVTTSAVVEAIREAYGDLEADRLAHSTGVHPAAFASVIRQHFEFGKRSVKASMVRAAVRASDERAICDLKAIAAARKEQIETRSQAA